jgi:hypothetical protein
MDLISTPLAVVLIVVGAVTLAAAALVGVRDPLPERGSPGRAVSVMVPWIGSLLIVVLLVRGSGAGAAFVGAALLVYVVVARSRSRRSSR